MSIEKKVPMSDFTEVTNIEDTARIIGLQDNENVKIPLQSLTAKILSRVDEDILTVNDINVEGGVTGFNPIGKVAEGDMRAVSGGEVWSSQRITLINSMLNGDFSDGLTSYNVGSNITDAVVNSGVLSFTGAGQVDVSDNEISNLLSINSTDVYYFYITAKSSNNGILYSNRRSNTIGIPFDLTNEFKPYSYISSVLSARFKIGGSAGSNIEVDSILALNLTETYGAEYPTVAELDNIMNTVGGYFNNSTSIDLGLVVEKLSAKAEKTELNKVDIEAKKQVGINVFEENDNIAPELFDTNYDDTNVWSAGFYDYEGNIQASTNTYYTKKLTKIVRGDYISNVQLASNGMAVVLFDKDMNFNKSYTSKPNSDWTITADVDGYIGFSKLKSLESTQNYCKTLQFYAGDVTSDVFLKSEDSKSVIIDVVKPYITPFILDTKNGFDNRAVKSIELISGSESQLKDENGNWLRLFITYIRITNFGTTSSTIVQVARWNEIDGNVGMNNIIVSNYGGDIGADENGFLTIVTKPHTSSGLSFRVIIDTNYLRQGIDTISDLTDSVELNTSYIYSNSNITTTNELGIALGDSITEFGNYPELLGDELSMPFLNAGVGGTRMGYHESATYGELSFYKIAEAIHNEDFTQVNNAIDTIMPTVTPSRQTRLTRTRNSLNNTDWSKVTHLNVFFGTNDFTANSLIGEVSLDNFDTNTVVGAFNYGIDKILSKYPLIKIFVFTPMFRYLNEVLPENSSDVFENSLGLQVIDYADAIKSIANLNHLTCKNLYKESGLNKYTHSIYYIDTTHPNDAGYVYLGKLTASFINSQFKI